MKKILFTSIVLAQTCLAFGQNGLTVFTPSAENGGLQGLAISENGKYICGSTDAYDGFIADVETQEVKFDVATDDMGCEYRAVSSTGVAVGFNGPGRTFDITGKATDITDMGLLEDITPDGKMISGSIIGELGYDTHACIWKDGEPAMLAEPADAWMGFETYGTSAKHISGDGSVMVGQAIDNYSTFPALMWRQNKDGSYSADPSAVRRYFEAGEGDKPYYWFSASNVSNNGKWMAVYVQPSGGYDILPARYNLETDELEVAEVEPSDDPYDGQSYQTSGIADDGTVVGFFGGMMMRQGFIWKGGEKEPKALAEVYDKCPLLGEMDANGVHVAADITSDGRYIMGFGVNTDWEFVTYVLDTEAYDPDAPTSVSTVEAKTGNGKKAVFDISGKRLPASLRGISIVRDADGTVRKVIKK